MQQIPNQQYQPTKAEIQIRYGVAYVLIIVFLGVFINTIFKSTGITLVYTFSMVLIHGTILFFYVKYRFKLWQDKNKPKEQYTEVVDAEVIK